MADIYKTKEIETNINERGVNLGNVDVTLYTMDKGSAAFKIYLKREVDYANEKIYDPVNLYTSDMTPRIDIVAADGSVFSNEPVDIVIPENGVIQYIVSDYVIRHAGKMDVYIYLENKSESVQVSNFYFYIEEDGVARRLGKEITGNRLEDIAKNVMSGQLMELLSEDFREQLDREIKEFLKINNKDFNLKFEDLTRDEKDELMKNLTNQGLADFRIEDNTITTSKITDDAITPEKTSFISRSNNLLNKNDVIANKNLDSNTGELINSSVSSVFNTWLPVSEGEVYTANSINTRAYYKSDKTFLSAITGNGTFTIPTGASYMRISTPKLNEAQLNRGSELLDYDEYKEPTLSSEIKINKLPDNIITTPLIKNNTITPEKTTFVRVSKNLIDKNSLIQGKSLNSKGEVSENSIFYITDYIPIKENETYTASSSPQNRVIFYDENKDYIDYKYEPKDTITFTTPKKTAYVRLNVYTTFKDTPMLNKGTELLPYEDWHEPYLEGVTAGNNIDSEKITKDIIKRLEEENTQTEIPIKDGKTFTLDTSLNLNYTPETIQGCSDNDPLPMGQIQYTDMYGMYDELCNKYPNYVSRKVEGKDILEDEIISYTFKPEEQSFTRNSEEVEKTFKRFKFFIVSSTHGNERTSIWVLYNLMKLICEKWQTNESLEFLRWNVEFVICPIISPGGYRNFTRINANGVDLNRNFDADWENGSSDKSSTTYRGDAPMSEPEAIVCDNIIKRENPNFVIDFHNFHAQSTPTSFNWIIGYSDKVNDIADLVLSKMARKWKKQYPDLPQDIVGFGYGSPGIQVGSLTNYAQKKYGIPSSLFEVCWKMDAKTDSIKRDSFISTIGLDSFSNFLLQIANNANEL
ncbi:M14 family zinc carboxypeptidase [Staphylococcus hominis]|uniref:M14 family zinc carboxypeptidase n=1 Tax=Staphylococcus hominis TaxID=1290 RepID=UPI0011A673EA|nr:M14 family zinc carboxypeptidase [Staphylococcus hominis]